MGLGDTLGVLPPENGGTGSTSQNFGELTYTMPSINTQGSLIYASLSATVPKGVYAVSVYATFPSSFSATQALKLELIQGYGEKPYTEFVINPLNLNVEANVTYVGMMQRLLCLPSDTVFQPSYWTGQNPKPMLRLHAQSTSSTTPTPTVRCVLTRLGGIS